MLKCVAVCCSDELDCCLKEYGVMLSIAAVRVAVCGNVLQHVIVCCKQKKIARKCVAAGCSALQCFVVCCIVYQCVAVCCSVVQ